MERDPGDRRWRGPGRSPPGLKEADGGGIVQYGVGPLTAALLAHDLLDELRLWVHPFLLGVTGPDVSILQPGTAAAFTLTDTTSLASGIVVLTYAFAPEATMAG